MQREVLSTSCLAFDLKVFFKKLRQELEETKQSLGDILMEELMNNLLCFLLQNLIYKSLEEIITGSKRNQLLKKLRDDKEIILGFFEQFMIRSNIEVQIDIIDNVLTLSLESKQDNLIKAIIRLEIFFQNRVSTAVLKAIITKNFSIPFSVEEEIVDFINACLTQSKEKCLVRDEEGMRDSKILYNSQRQPKSLKHYAPHITLSQIMRLK